METYGERDARSGLLRGTAGEWMALETLKKAAAEMGNLNRLVSLAEDDVRDSDCFHRGNQVWGRDGWTPFAYDADLFNFLAVLYVSNLLGSDRTEFDAACSSLRGSVSRNQLLGLCRFGRQLSACDFDATDARAWQTMETRWKMFRPSMPTLLELVRKLVTSSYFVSLPRRDEGPACANAVLELRKLAEQGPEELKKLEADVLEIYRKETVSPTDKDWKAYMQKSYDAFAFDCDTLEWGEFTSQQARSLLVAMNSSTLLFLLVSTRPVKSVFLSHLLAMYDCTVHARLWLLQSFLPVYCSWRKLNYKTLGRPLEMEDLPQCWQLEEEALGSGLGFLHSIPSYVERLLRQEALDAHLQFSCLGQTGVIVPITSPCCKNLQVWCHITRPEQADKDDRQHALFLDFPHTLWHEPVDRLEHWLKNDDEQLKKYQSTTEFINYVVDMRDNSLLYRRRKAEELARKKERDDAAAAAAKKAAAGASVLSRAVWFSGDEEKRD